MSIRFPGCCIH
ncbi:unnamed protein product [Rhodiola kirilowii]